MRSRRGAANPRREAYRQTREARNSLYLNSRGIRPETLNAPRFRGTWGIDPRGNLVFAHRDEQGDLTGYELKNVGFTGFAKGGRKAMWRSREFPGDTCLVLVESAIDAYSHGQLFPDKQTRYWSIGGTMSPYQRSLIAAEIKRLPSQMTIVAGFDSDAAGESLRAVPQFVAARDAPQIVEPPERSCLVGGTPGGHVRSP